MNQHQFIFPHPLAELQNAILTAKQIETIRCQEKQLNASIDRLRTAEVKMDVKKGELQKDDLRRYKRQVMDRKAQQPARPRFAIMQRGGSAHFDVNGFHLWTCQQLYHLHAWDRFFAVGTETVLPARRLRPQRGDGGNKALIESDITFLEYLRDLYQITLDWTRGDDSSPKKGRPESVPRSDIVKVLYAPRRKQAFQLTAFIVNHYLPGIVFDCREIRNLLKIQLKVQKGSVAEKVGWKTLDNMSSPEKKKDIGAPEPLRNTNTARLRFCACGEMIATPDCPYCGRS